MELTSLLLRLAVVGVAAVVVDVFIDALASTVFSFEDVEAPATAGGGGDTTVSDTSG